MPVATTWYLLLFVPDLLRIIQGAAGLGDIDIRSISLGIGDALIEEDDPGDDVYVLVEGSLRVERHVDDRPAPVATLDEPGTVVGELSVMNGGRRTATVTTAKPSKVLRVPRTSFDQLLTSYPEVAEALAADAVRRAEEAELAEVFSAYFGVTDESVIATLTGSARWRRVAAGEVLFEEGSPADAAYFVLRGRLVATRTFDDEQTIIGEITRGEVVGETGLLDDQPRNATVTVARDTVLAAFDREVFLGLVHQHPHLLVELGSLILRRARHPARRRRLSLVVAVVVCDRFDLREIASRLQSELHALGSVELLWPDRVDSMLETPGVSQSRPGEVGDVRVSKLLHQLELEADHVLLEVGRARSGWSRRSLTMADRIVVLTPPVPTREETERLHQILADAPTKTQRTLVVAHHPDTAVPTGSADLVDTFRAHDVLHLHRGSMSEIARLGRVIVGRGTGLVLGGGGARGFAHLGVYRALTELGVPIDIVGGASIGSPLAAGIADRLAPDVLEDLVRDLFRRVLDYTVPVVSLVKGQGIAAATAKAFGERTIEDLWTSYFCVSTNLTTARTFVHRRGPVVGAVRASCAIPGVMPPVPHDDHLLVDGGVLNNLPVDVMRQISPHGDVVAVDVAPLSGPSARSDFGLSVSGWKALRSSLGRRPRTYPGITAVLMRSLIAGSQRHRDDVVAAGMVDCYLDLDLRGVSMLAFDTVTEVARRGYDAAMPRLERWLEGEAR